MGREEPESTVARIGWRLLDVSKIEGLNVLDRSFEGSRSRSHSAHHEWEAIHARVT
jgi:hypothetical protein